MPAAGIALPLKKDRGTCWRLFQFYTTYPFAEELAEQIIEPATRLGDRREQAIAQLGLQAWSGLGRVQDALHGAEALSCQG